MSEEALPSAMSLGYDPVADIDAALLLELSTGGDAMVLADVECTPIGPELAAQLAAFNTSPAGGWDLVEAAAGWARLIAWAEAKRASVVAALVARREMQLDSGIGYGSVNPVTNTAVEVAARTVTTARQAEHLVGRALQLVEDFPSTHAALSDGLIDLRRVRVITDELGGQDPQVRARVESAVLPDAPGLDSVALRKRVKRLLHELAPVETAERCQIAREGRYVAITPSSDGMAFLEAHLPAEHATALDTALNAAAADAKRADTAAGAPARTHDQRRADALAELGWAALAACAEAATGPATPDRATDRGAARDHAGSGRAGRDHAGAAGHDLAADHSPPDAAAYDHSPRDHTVRDHARPGSAMSGRAMRERASDVPATARRESGPVRRRPVMVNVTVPFATAAGLSDEPGEIDGYGPIPAHVARELAAAGVWRWLRTDPGTGQLLDLGRTRYRPSTALAEFIIARDRTCRMPGCHRPATRCDIDHVVSYTAGGTTSVTGCHCLCRTHHLLKHRGRWIVERRPDGTTRWRSPTGHHYTRPPEAIGPVGGPAPPGDPPPG